MSPEGASPGASGQTEIGLYLYGVVLRECAEEPLRSPGVGSDPFVRFLVSAGLAAAVSPVPLDEFAVERVNALLRSGKTQWVEEKALAHASVLQELMQRGPVVPVRFGILFREESRLVLLIEEQQADLVSLLARLRDCVEWGVKVLCPEAIARENLLREDQEIAALHQRIGAMPEGVGYLYQKRLDMMAQEKLQLLLPQWAAEIHEALAALSQEAAGQQPIDREQSGKKEIAVHHGAYLVRGEQTSRFLAEVERLGALWAAHGFRFDLSGPWPPYHFARLRLAEGLP